MTNQQLSDKIGRSFREMPPVMHEIRCEELCEMFFEGLKHNKSCREIAEDFLEKYAPKEEQS